MPTQSKHLQIAIEAAKSAGETVMRYYNADSVITEVKSDGSPVTAADKEAEEVIIDIIKKAFPDHGFLGEESGDNTKDREYVWIIDPIDGTKAFARKYGNFSTEIALMHNGTIITGVSYNPAFNVLAYAEKGKGAYHGEQRLSVSPIERLSEAYMTHGSLNAFSRIERIPQLVSLSQNTYYSRPIGDFWQGYLVAAGKIDIALEPHISIWDIAAKTIIIEEAGGMATDIDGSPITRKSATFCATNGKLHGEVVAMLKT